MAEITVRLSTALADRYKIERELGEGGMATVYLAEDLKVSCRLTSENLRGRYHAGPSTDNDHNYERPWVQLDRVGAGPF